MTPARFDFSTASPADVRQEAMRRADRRARGLPLSGDAPLVREVPTGPQRRDVWLSWSLLVADNAKWGACPRGKGAALVLTKPYREAKRLGKAQIIEQIGELAPLEGSVRVSGIFIEPNRSSRRDLSNYMKLVHDILTGLVYVDDSQIDDVHWSRGTPNIDAPRLVLTIEAIP